MRKNIIVSNICLCNTILLSWHSHSDYNLVELESETIKEDDRTVLMEGGLTKSSSTKLPSPSIKTNLIR